MGRKVAGVMLAVLVGSALMLAGCSESTSFVRARDHSEVETNGLTACILQDYNGSDQRWRDIGENVYNGSYQTAFGYKQADVVVTYERTSQTFAGAFSAIGLKPNFAYQLKLMGKPTEDQISNQHLREIGRSYDIALNQSVGYVIFDYLITDRNGTAYKEFSLANSYHVLWKVSQRTPQPSDSTPTWYEAQGSPDDPPHAYAAPVGPTNVGVYAEWEKGIPENVKLPFGDYHVEFIITEESFHSAKGDPTGGYWSTVMGCDVNFTIGIRVPEDYPTIQEAINNANEGDAIFVRNGTYEEDLVVNKSVSLLGKNKLTTIISGRRLLEEVVVKINASDIQISNFTIRRGFIGIGFEYASNVIIANNIIDDNIFAGIALEDANATIVENTISNTRGLLESTAISGYLVGNTTLIYHNNFINNVVRMDRAEAIWDDGYPSGGNFWDDYSDSDLYCGPCQNETGSDRTGDVPVRIIDLDLNDFCDRYPLIFPYGYVPSPDFNNDRMIDIFDLVKIALSCGSVPGMPIWNPYVDLNQDSIIDIFDLVVIAVNFGEQWSSP